MDFTALLHALVTAGPLILAGMILLKIVRKANDSGKEFHIEDHLESLVGLAVLTAGIIFVLNYGISGIKNVSSVSTLLKMLATFAPWIAYGLFLYNKLRKGGVDFKIEDHLESIGTLAAITLVAQGVLSAAVNQLNLGI